MEYKLTLNLDFKTGEELADSINDTLGELMDVIQAHAFIGIFIHNDGSKIVLNGFHDQADEDTLEQMFSVIKAADGLLSVDEGERVVRHLTPKGEVKGQMH